LTLKKWSELEMIVHINFTNPKMISQGYKFDKVGMEIKNLELFVSKESGASLKEGDYETDADSLSNYQKTYR